MTRPIGFSTGALAFGDYERGLEALRSRRVDCVELSALRQNELLPLVNALTNLELSSFRYIAFHAPSGIAPGTEAEVADFLLPVAEHGWPIIMHPDAIQDWALWARFGELLCIENMDKRKPIGRTADELERIFDRLPDASFCFDIGHARQVDSTMTEAYFLLQRFGSKLRQVHVSEVNTRSKHDALSYGSILAFRSFANIIPEATPLIIEAVIEISEMESEMETVRAAFSRDACDDGGFGPQTSDSLQTILG